MRFGSMKNIGFEIQQVAVYVPVIDRERGFGVGRDWHIIGRVFVLIEGMHEFLRYYINR